MPIHVQTPEGKVLTWAEKEDMKMLEHMRQAPIRIFEETHDALMGHLKRPSFHTTITRDWMDKINDGIFFDPYAETERGEK